MKKIWTNMNSKHRRIAVVVGLVSTMFLIIALFPASERERTSSSRQDDQTFRHVLTDRNTDSLRVENLLAQINNLRADQTQIVDRFELLQRDITRMEFGNLGPRMARETEAINSRIDILIEQVARLERVASSGSAINPINITRDQTSPQDGDLVSTSEAVEVPLDPSLVSVSPDSSTSTNQIDEQSLWDRPPPPVIAPPSRSRRDSDPSPATPVSSMRIVEYQPTPEELAASKAASETPPEPDPYLPTGSIITGTILTGLDAPTGKAARQDPHPALIRIKHEAILPNYFTSDIRECFLILGGYGELSSERAYLRTETLSCVTEDNEIIEAQLEGYAVGEDGKAGLRGRLVSKQGQIIAKSLSAGALEGFASSFKKTPVPRIALGDQQLYEQALSSESVQSGAISGVGSALDRVAQFYLDQAEGMFPVIEIDAGREIEIILVRGTSLSVKK